MARMAGRDRIMSADAIVLHDEEHPRWARANDAASFPAAALRGRSHRTREVACAARPPRSNAVTVRHAIGDPNRKVDFCHDDVVVDTA